MKVKQNDPCVIHYRGQRHPRLNSVYANFDKAAEVILAATDAWPKGDSPVTLSPYEIFEAISWKLIPDWGIVRVNWYAVEVSRTTYAMRTYQVAAENLDDAHARAVIRAEDDEWGGGNAEYEVEYSEEIGPPDEDEPDTPPATKALGIVYRAGSGQGYTNQDILNLCKGNPDLADHIKHRVLEEDVDAAWHIETLIEEYLREGEIEEKDGTYQFVSQAESPEPPEAITAIEDVIYLAYCSGCGEVMVDPNPKPGQLGFESIGFPASAVPHSFPYLLDGGACRHCQYIDRVRDVSPDNTEALRQTLREILLNDLAVQVDNGDFSVLEELLGFLPDDKKIGALDETLWPLFKSLIHPTHQAATTMSTKLSPNAQAIRSDVEGELLGLFSLIGMDTPENMGAIVDFCAEDVAATADPTDWHDGDVAIAFRRFIETISPTL